MRPAGDLVSSFDAWATWVDEVAQTEIALAHIEGRLPVVDLVEALADCPPDVRARVHASMRQQDLGADNRARRAVWALEDQAKAAEKLAQMLWNKGNDEGAQRQRDRAASLRARAALGVQPEVEEVEGDETVETPSTTVQDLLGDAAPPAEPKPKKEEPVKTPKPQKVKKERVAKPAKPRKDPVILLRDPEIKRNKDGKITSITGRCTWRGCTKTRTIHAADAFQVRFCKEHKAEAAKEARAKKAKK